MKKIILPLLLLFISTNAYSQRYDFRRNELKFNLITAIAGLPEFNYERLLDDNMGIGTAVAFSLEKPENMSLRGYVMPYCRMYFGERRASGFFLEANLALINESESFTNYFIGSSQDPTSHVNYAVRGGFGTAVGFKIAKSNVVGELYLGVGRVFGNSFIDAYPRIGITIGRRF